MTDITELAQRMKAAAEKATQGEWWADEVKNEGCYGSGDDCVEGFTSYAIYGSDGQTLFDSLNSDAACICEEYDGEEHAAWDETAQRNAEFIALANPVNVLALVEALEKAQQVDEELCKLLPLGAEYMDPPDGGDVTLLEGVRRMVADYRQRIAELESRAVKLPPKVDSSNIPFAGHTWNCCLDEVEKRLANAGIKVETE
ncbi:ead/Ea22-like family protein [Klebsiella quasipneumoniae]|nr:ead/Ea22-like family protein [Klebsiella quasipneumoniae subsp. similipneumoniae]